MIFKVPLQPKPFYDSVIYSLSEFVLHILDNFFLYSLYKIAW